MNTHLSKKFDSELDAIRAHLTRMGGLVEEQIRAAITVYAEQDPELIETIISRDDRVDEMEILIDDACTHIVARRQPTAIDLRMVMGVGKVVTDLERIGDEAKKIAKATRHILERGINQDMTRVVEIGHLGGKVVSMLHDVLDAFVRLDVSSAAAVVRQDREIDAHFRSIVRNLITYMMEDPRTISTALEVLSISKSIERIGDHCKNIAKDVIYIANGRDVRHIGLDALEREINTPPITPG